MRTRLDSLSSVLLGMLLVLFAGCVAAPTTVAVVPAPEAARSSGAIIRSDWIHHPVIGREAMVVSQNAIASEIGHQILLAGGNAVDAAVATGFALAVTLPRAGNLGGSGFMLVHLAESGKTVALDFRSAAPLAFEPSLYRKPDGSIDWQLMTFGAMAPAVPGTVAGLYEAWQRFGTLPWAELLEPALELATKGIVVSDDLAFALAQARDVLSRYPGSAAAYLKADGSTYQPGELLIQSDLAWSLRAIRDGGADAFYRGKITERILDYLADTGGIISADDLQQYRVRERPPVIGRYRGNQIIAAPPVSGGGVTLVQMLHVLEHFPVGQLPAASADSLHLLAEVMKRSAANRRVGIGDPDFVDVPITGFTNRAFAREIAGNIDLAKATPVSAIEPADALKLESRDTTHFSIVDRYGNAVANTYTLGYSFGSGMAIPGTGILLDNQMRNFSHREPDHANAPAPGKRMVSTMTPTIVLDPDDELLLVTGTPGGSRIINVLLQLIVNVIDHGMNIAEATQVPRIYQGWRTSALGVEPGIGVDTIALLRERGHDVGVQQTMGSTQSIVVRDSFLYGSADPRRPGALAVGH
ncbi:MAG: gamma-glutamyltransferase [Gammaproteobacteria bacterium]|nr:gamma-glutamyltransferase [Gammaproteobacteria bacterium]